MKYLFVDTETTGKIPRGGGEIPRLVQLGYILVDAEYESGRTRLAGKEWLIRPQGFEIPVEATAIHGISQAQAEKDGFELVWALNDLSRWIPEASVVVGHNVSYDMIILRNEFKLVHNIDPFGTVLTFDTMQAGTALCQIPGPYGFKWPKLSELYEFLFKEPLMQTHTALADLEATVQCFFEMIRIGHIKITA